MKKEIETYNRSSHDPRAFVILDDCLYDNSWAEKLMRLLFMTDIIGKLYLLSQCNTHLRSPQSKNKY